MTDASDSGAQVRALEVARELAFPRASGTPGDRRAIDLLSGWFREAGLTVTEEWFSFDIGPAIRALRCLLISAALLSALAGVIAGQSRALALLILALALAAGGTFLAWAPWLERLYRRDGPTRTANLVARRPVDEARLTLVLLAHHDSKSQNLSLPLRAGFTLSAIGSGLALLVVLAWSLMSGSNPDRVTMGLGFTAALSLLPLAVLRNGNDSPGGVDNAGSVGILVELAHRLPVRVAADVELIFLSPGAEEDHMIGAMRWLDAHHEELAKRPVWAINMDGVGIPGRVTLLERYGLGARFSAHLSAVARRASRQLDLPVRGILIPPAMGVDAIPFAHRGIPCLTLTSGSLGRASLSVHSRNDRFEHLDEQILQSVADLVVAMVEDLVGEPKKERAGATAPAR